MKPTVGTKAFKVASVPDETVPDKPLTNEFCQFCQAEIMIVTQSYCHGKTFAPARYPIARTPRRN
jgi:hypothetical protein